MTERAYRIPLDLHPQPEGGHTVTSPLLPELVTEGDTLDESLANAREAFEVVLEIYEDDGRDLPEGLIEDAAVGTLHTEQLVPA